ncbi:MAG: tyrosine-type recombinase/integrase, partial [Deltaproteobacteria bacterium]|nr:tyrosine-type recombinase/integrase [Deltaproteobacteria bacterium]
IPILIGVNVITFVLFFVVNSPEDMARLHLGERRVTQDAIEKWKADLRKTLKPGSVNRHMTVLKHMFKKGVEWGLVKTNPTVGIKRFPEADPRTRFLDEDELERLLSACKEQKRQPWLLPLVTLAVHTGMRQGELLGLRWSNVDLDHGLITLQQSKT